MKPLLGVLCFILGLAIIYLAISGKTAEVLAAFTAPSMLKGA